MDLIVFPPLSGKQ